MEVVGYLVIWMGLGHREWCMHAAPTEQTLHAHVAILEENGNLMALLTVQLIKWTGEASNDVFSIRMTRYLM